MEFEDKKVAKRVASRLNGQPIGGKKRSAYYYDLWYRKSDAGVTKCML